MPDARETVLPLTLVNREQFLDLFYDPLEFDIQIKATLYLHILRVDSGDFVLGQLYTTLSNSTLGYVLSRHNVEKLKSNFGRTMELTKRIRAQFKKPDPNAGEGGEVLLYSFLEGHLGAPKILSKMELKTSQEFYVHGADGIHLLQSGENQFQLIFGESKMYANAHEGIKAAFKSMSKVEQENFDSDTWLVESELLKESLEADKLEILESILLPSARGENPIKKSNAFGVFIGYEIDGTTLKQEEMTSEQIETHLRQLAEDVIRVELHTIQTEIANRGWGGYHFHIYAVPFVRKVVTGESRGIDNVRFDLAAALGNNAVQE